MVHYIGWYIGQKEDTAYSGNVPGKLKMRYVAKKLMQVKGNLRIFSLADKNVGTVYGEQKTSDNGMEIIYSGGYGSKGKLGKMFNSYLKLFQFINYLVFRTKKEDTIYLYHSYVYTNVAAMLKKIIKRKIILEVEEVYGYSAVGDRSWVTKEISNIKKMDAFMFVNEGIPKDLEIPADKYVVSYGVCDIPERTLERFDDGRIHIVYAGTVEKRKLGAITAVQVASLLPNNYHLHILGFGSKENLDYLNSEIEKVNMDDNTCFVSYEGYKTGAELSEFLFSCHIGLSSNVIRPNFANNSFPSKVITYMCHDLAIVLGYAKAFYDVEASRDWNFYMEQKPENIADAVKAATPVEVGHFHELINKMDNDLVSFILRN